MITLYSCLCCNNYKCTYRGSFSLNEMSKLDYTNEINRDKRNIVYYSGENVSVLYKMLKFATLKTNLT